jgi:hypothetical protein
VIGFVSFDPVITRRSGAVGRGDNDGGSFRVLVVIVVEDMGVEGLVIWGNGVENSSDGTNEIEVDDETPGNAFCMEGCWRMQQLKLWVGFEGQSERMEYWDRIPTRTYA